MHLCFKILLVLISARTDTNWKTEYVLPRSNVRMGNTLVPAKINAKVVSILATLVQILNTIVALIAKSTEEPINIKHLMVFVSVNWIAMKIAKENVSI